MASSQRKQDSSVPSSSSSTTTSPGSLPLDPAPVSSTTANVPATTSMAHHRQVLQRKLIEQKDTKFASPTDELLSPCSQRLKEYKAKKATRLTQTLFKNTKAGVPTGKNLFAKPSTEKLSSESSATKDNACATPDGQKGQGDEKENEYDL